MQCAVFCFSYRKERGRGNNGGIQLLTKESACKISEVWLYCILGAVYRLIQRDVPKMEILLRKDRWQYLTILGCS